MRTCIQIPHPPERKQDGLLLRGLRTLKVRLDRISATTLQVVQFLKQHPKIERLLFPWDESFPKIQLARKQMKGACGLLTVVIQTKRMEDIVRFCESLQHFLMAVSWGGYESLVIPKCASLSPADFSADNPEHRMVRIYLGLEDAEYLIADLRQALDSF